MLGPFKQADSLSVATSKSHAILLVKGRGSFKTSTALKKFGLDCVKKSRKLVLDMHDCESMDSTFMGVLAGLALKMRREKKGRITMINLSRKTDKLLQTLGVHTLIDRPGPDDLSADLKKKITGAGRLSKLTAAKSDKRTTAETMLEAHETLVKVAPENLSEFQDVLTYLKRELDKGIG